jgi:hypothetical protein
MNGRGRVTRIRKDPLMTNREKSGLDGEEKDGNREADLLWAKKYQERDEDRR